LNHFDPRVLAKLKNLYLRARFVVDGVMVGIHPSRAKGRKDLVRTELVPCR